MPKTQIIFYKDDNGDIPVLQWLQALLKQDRKGYANCIARIEQLAASGYELRRPAADYLRDGIYELRAKHVNVQYRILYFFYGQNVAILAHAMVKSDSEVPDVDIERAIRRKMLLEDDINLHTYNHRVEGQNGDNE